jgi:dihydrodipicolinate synthase/N-acetylneuraminate lyase
MSHAAESYSVAKALGRIRERRKIYGITAVLLPYRADGSPDLDQFEQHLKLTVKAGIEPAINMDTGFGPQLSPAGRREVLARTRKVIGNGAAFTAGACALGYECEPLTAYRQSVQDILEVGVTPIVFQHNVFNGKSGAEIATLYRQILEGAPRAFAFELGQQFAPFGQIYSLDTYERLLDIPNLVGAKHSSLDRRLELQRLDLRDRKRPDWHVFTGNDLAIDLVMYGSDYLLGLSTFDPEAFALRDAWWAAGDARFFQLNDALQALGMVAFRDPVPAYKHSAAEYLNLTGRMKNAGVHPSCPRRPAWEKEILAPIAKLIEDCKSAPERL